MFMLVLGDSLSMAYHNVGVEIKDTYSYALQRYLESRYTDVYARTVSLTGTPIGTVLEQASTWLLPNLGEIDISVLQFGIVDCAPHPIPQVLRTALVMLPLVVRNPTIKLLHNYRSYIQWGKHPYRKTHTKQFNECYGELLTKLSAQSRLVIVLGIAPGKSHLYKRSPGLERSISEYNRLIQKMASKHNNVRLIDLTDKLSSDPELYLTDDLHIKKGAHSIIADEIIEVIGRGL